MRRALARALAAPRSCCAPASARAAPAAPRSSIRRCGSASCRPSTSSSISIRARSAWRSGWPASPRRPGARSSGRSASRRRGGPTSCSPIRPRSSTATRRRCPTTRSSSTPSRRPAPSLDFDDWLRLVFTHEFTHIVHLDRSEGWARAVRAIFGRTVIAFPESVSAAVADRRAGDLRRERDHRRRAAARRRLPRDRRRGGAAASPRAARSRQRRT